MNRYIIGSLWDRLNRNGANKNFEYLFEGRQKIDELNYRADKILRAAEIVNENNNNTNDRLDRFIADSGTSSTEVVDARGTHTVLSGRLDEYGADIEYINYRPLLSDGTITLPSDFPVYDLNVQRSEKFNYIHGHTPYNIHDWSSATHLYLTVNSSISSDGKNPLTPISFGRFKANLLDGIYGTDDLIINLVDNIVSEKYGLSGVKFDNNNVLFRSRSSSGFSWLGLLKREGLERNRWINDSGIYSCEMTWSITDIVAAVVNLSITDAFGMPAAYREVDTLAACQGERGTFFQSSAKVYCNPYLGEDIHDINPFINKNTMNFNNHNKLLVFENVGFIAETSHFIGYGLDSKFRYFGCKFYRGLANAYAVSGIYDARLFDSVAAYGSTDGFNYHTTDPNSKAVEINCKGYWNGTKYALKGGNTARLSNNGSTAHDGMYMLRIGGRYWKNQGPVVADVNDCYSISIGCRIGDNQADNDGDKMGYWLQGAIKPKYVIESEVIGSNLDISVHSNVPSITHLMDITGKPVSTTIENTVNWIDGSDF